MHIAHLGTTKANGIHSLDVSGHKTKHWINSNYDLVMTPDEKQRGQ